MTTAPGGYGSGAQLPRLLALVPYLLARPRARLADVAQVFGITEDRLRKDLDLLWVCGLPGHGPGDLIDVEFEGDTVTLFEPAGVTRPLRLTVDEALALVVALRTLRGATGLAEHDALDRVLAKIEAVAGSLAGPARRVQVSLEGQQRALPVVRSALEQGRRLHLDYHVPGRDETTERDVDPLRLLLVEGRSYLEGWCYRAEDTRLFRLDRIDRVEVLEQEVVDHAGVEVRDLDAGLFTAGPDALPVVLRLAPAAAWVADQYRAVSAVPSAGGGLVLTLRVTDTAWVRRLLLRLGGAAQALAPPELVEQVRAEAASALSAYEVGYGPDSAGPERVVKESERPAEAGGTNPKDITEESGP